MHNSVALGEGFLASLSTIAPTSNIAPGYQESNSSSSINSSGNVTCVACTNGDNANDTICNPDPKSTNCTIEVVPGSQKGIGIINDESTELCEGQMNPYNYSPEDILAIDLIE